MTNKGVLLGLVLIVIFGCSNIYAADPSSSTMQLTCPYWNGTFDAAGFSDVVNWGNSPYHPHGYHELLSGEWGAAIYYDDISTDPNAMWLTDYFRYPYWYTNSDFQIQSNCSRCSRWDDPCNPVSGYDTGQSKIINNEVEVTIDYEIADIGSSTYSPTVYHEPNELPEIAKSERYVLLKTYTIKNIKESGNVTGLEFCQMLHSHGADEYAAVVHCSYDDLDINDPLENYSPYNAVHTRGKFRYDITQWNNIDDPAATKNHVDWVGFSSAIEPNIIECGYYEGSSGKPATGTHIDIENRSLDSNDYSYGETAGAMGWYLPALEPNETTSITVAFMFATSDWPFPTILTKANADPNNECVYPWNFIENNYLTFDICYDANGYALDDVVITDYLPIEVDYYSSTPAGDHNFAKHTVTWTIGDLAEEDSNCIELVTKVNYYAKPGGIFTNEVRMESSEGICAEAATDVNVCYDGYGMSIIYVDKDANDPNSFNNGRSWDNAYTDLRDAFTGAESGGASVTAIWVAEGTYRPVYDTNDSSYKNESFNLVEDVGVFGHFGGVGTYETSTTQRVFSDSNNTTILEGQIGDNDNDAVKYIVKAQNIDRAIVDGFTIKGSYGSNAAGIYLYGSDISVVNCKLKENDDYGIYAKNYSYPDVHNCLFLDNRSRDVYSDTSQPDISYCTMDGNDTGDYGVYLINGSTSNISNTHIKNHSKDGIYGSNATITLTNNSKIMGSDDNGIEGSNCDLTVEKSVIEICTDNAIYLASYSDIDITKSVIRKNGEQGIYLSQNSGTSILNNWIHNNGTDQVSSRASGIYFYNQIGIPLVRNNTIYDNYTYGIESSENGADPNIINCIIYGNDSNDLYRENDTFDTVNYCNLQNSHAGTGNITGDPCFVDPDSNDLHIREYSVCKDTGDPNGSYGDETDIDGEARIIYGRVDIGADEYYWSPADFDEDGTVNFIDYAIFAAAWQSEPNDDNYDEDCDLEDNNSIDYNDLALFCEDWLWEVAWGDTQWMMSMGGGGMGFGLESISLESAYSLESSKTALTSDRDALMLSTATESLEAMPERLRAKSQKFYNITPQAIAESKTVKPKPPTMRELYELHTELLKWLDEIWLNGDLKEYITEEQYLEFRKAIEESGF